MIMMRHCFGSGVSTGVMELTTVPAEHPQPACQNNWAGTLEIKHESSSLYSCPGDVSPKVWRHGWTQLSNNGKGLQFLQNKHLIAGVLFITATMEADGTDEHSKNLVTSFCLWLASSTPLPVAYIRISSIWRAGITREIFKNPFR